jgi:acetaldehyde dehydrogenase
VPPATFRTTVHAVAAGGADPAAVRAAVDEAASGVRAFAPGYTVRECTVRGEWITVSVEVTADSDVLPRHAGNLDIINSAAIMVAERHASHADRAVAVEAGR